MYPGAEIRCACTRTTYMCIHVCAVHVYVRIVKPSCTSLAQVSWHFVSGLRLSELLGCLLPSVRLLIIPWHFLRFNDTVIGLEVSYNFDKCWSIWRLTGISSVREGYTLQVKNDVSIMAASFFALSLIIAHLSKLSNYRLLAWPQGMLELPGVG